MSASTGSTLNEASPDDDEVKGPRTGVTVAREHNSHDLEDPAELFDTAQSPKNDTRGEEPQTEKKKPKKQTRFSLEPNGRDEDDDDQKNRSLLRKNHPARHLARGGLNDRDSWDPDMSSVSTAAASLRSDAGNPDDDEEDVEVSRLAEKGKDDQNAALLLGPNLSSPPQLDSFDDEDLLPPGPPPDMDYPNADEDTEDEEDLISQKEAPKKRPSKSPKKSDTNDYSDDDNKEGAGFDMLGGDDESDEPTTPASVKEKRRRKQDRLELISEKKNKRMGAKKKNDSRKSKPSKKRKADDETESESEVAPAPKARKTSKKTNRFATTFSPKGVPLPRTFNTIPASDFKRKGPPGEGVRRSKRSRTTPLEFWRGEKVLYGPNNFGDDYDGVTNMPIVVAFDKANPTPYKPRKPVAAPKKKSKGKGSSSTESVAKDSNEPLDPDNLAVDYEFNDGKVATLWDERYQDTRPIKVMTRLATIKANNLPISKLRKKSEGKVVAKASQSFQMIHDDNPMYPSYLAGHLVLPPRSIKDAESVGLCAQVFTVIKGQANSLELSYGDPEHEGSTPGQWIASEDGHFLMSPGDTFLIPPGNTYRLRNHSKTTECTTSWVIIRHNQHAVTEEE